MTVDFNIYELSNPSWIVVDVLTATAIGCLYSLCKIVVISPCHVFVIEMKVVKFQNAVEIELLKYFYFKNKHDSNC